MAIILMVLAGALAALPSVPRATLGGGRLADYEAQAKREAIVADGLWSKSPCPEAVAEIVGRHATDVRGLSANRRLIYGGGTIFIEHVQVTGCGRSTRQNVLMFRHSLSDNEGWASTTLLPGASRASPRLQDETARKMFPAMLTYPAPVKCDAPDKTLQSDEVVLISEPDSKGRWTEMWAFKICGESRPALVTYAPKSRGDADIAIKPLWSTVAGAPPRQIDLTPLK